MCCLCYQPQWLPSPCSDMLIVSESLWHLFIAELFFISDCFCFSGSFSVSQMGLECLLDSGWGTHQIGHRKWVNNLCGFPNSTFPARVWEQASIQVLITKSQGFPQPLLLVPLSLQSAKGALHLSDPRGGSSSMLLKLHSLQWIDYTCIVSAFLNLLPEAQVLIWSFPSYPTLHVSFLQPWLFRSLFASIQLVFSENFFPLVDVFLICSWEEGHILLLHHLDLSP